MFSIDEIAAFVVHESRKPKQENKGTILECQTHTPYLAPLMVCSNNSGIIFTLSPFFLVQQSAFAVRSRLTIEAGGRRGWRPLSEAAHNSQLSADAETNAERV